MIIQNLINRSFTRPKNQATNMAPDKFLAGVDYLDFETTSKQIVNGETSRNVATAYRCINVLSDDVAKLPIQTFMSREPGEIDRVRPNNLTENISWLLEVSPNRWMTPFVFKKQVIMWLLTYGEAHIWQPVRRAGHRNELFVLPQDKTELVVEDGKIWYQVTVPGFEKIRYPEAEVLTLLINSKDGFTGRGVIAYARETIGRQLANYATQNRIAGKGLNPSGIMWMSGELDKEARKKVREVYEETMRESGMAIFDTKVTKFEPVTMKPVDVQFLESIQENDAEIANFFGVPLYKLNQGKQSYQSNEQQNLDYLNTTLDPYLVQWEQAAALKWLTEDQQNYTYFRFNRDALLRTDAKTRTEMLAKRIQSGQLTPNQACQIEDMPSYEGGDQHYLQGNMAVIEKDGNLKMGNKEVTNG